MFRKAGLPRVVPYLNGGFIVFQKGVANSFFDAWKAMAEWKWEYDPDIFYEQMGIALAASKLNFEVGSMTERDHGFGWEAEPLVSRLYHTGGPQLLRYTRQALRVRPVLGSAVPLPWGLIVRDYFGRLRRRLSGRKRIA
jgi:hypothetical protein